MRTVKALRTAIETNNHELKIGKMQFSGQPGSDIDIYIKSELVGWISSSTPDETKLEDVSMSVNDGVFKNKDENKRMSELEKSIEGKNLSISQLEAHIGELKAELEIVQRKPAIKDGMIFAYEKVLKIGHDQPEDMDQKVDGNG